NIGQVYHHYGSDGGDAVLGSIGTMVFLPGLDHRTAEYASKRIGQATVWQSTSVDVKEGTKFDSERTSEVGRALMDASEVRRMVKYRQAVAIIGNAPPVRFSYPPIAKRADAPPQIRERRLRPPIIEHAIATPIPAEPDEKDALVVADYRPTFSFRQLMNPAHETAPPEYDTEQIPPRDDPSFADVPDRAELER
ncbi:MAG: TraM recognition domain-containing protein, partial [Gammaproteobacteria bacterium]